MVTAYPVSGKRKSLDLCLAFVRGCGGQIGTDLRPGPAFFYGVDESNVGVWREVLASGRDYYYCDNSYFDSARQECFRVTKNGLQHHGYGRSDGKRFRALGVEIKPWRAVGEHIVVCPQSEPFMRTMARYEGNWESEIAARLAAVTSRTLRVRSWSANKGKLAATLGQDLEGAHALVTWSSAAAITAVLAGVPVIVEGEDCAARRLSGVIDQIESLPTPERENWAGVLADNQWTPEELTNGTAWANFK